MPIKVIGIGNRIMKDDAIGVMITEQLKDWLNTHEIEAVIGETDAEACFYDIKEEEILIIIDATQYGIRPGTVTYQELATIEVNYKNYSQHDMNLIKLLKHYATKMKGYFIGIEIEEIGFGTELSAVLEHHKHTILNKIREFIVNILKAYKDV